MLMPVVPWPRVRMLHPSAGNSGSRARGHSPLIGPSTATPVTAMGWPATVSEVYMIRMKIPDEVIAVSAIGWYRSKVPWGTAGSGFGGS